MEGEFAVKANSSSGVVYEGGIAGRTSVSYSVSIKNYTNKTELNGTIIGGLVGEIQNSGGNKQIILENCLNLAKLTTTSYVGGLVGNMNATQATIRNCANGGELTGTGNYAAGGLVTHTTTTAVTCENSLYLKKDKVTKGLGDQADSAGVITLDAAKVTNGTFSTPIADFLSAIAPTALTVSGDAKLDGTSLTYTEAGEQEIIFYWNSTELYRKTVTVTAKDMSSETVEIVGVSDSYANDTAAAADLNDVRVIYNGTELVRGTDYTISAADSKFTITFKGNYSGTKTQDYALNTAFTATANSLTITYDGKPHSIEVTTNATKDMSVLYGKTAESCTETSYEETDAGTYTVYWQATKGGMTITGSAVLTITKAAQDISYETKSVSKRIGAANFTYKLTVNEDKTFGEITYESSNESVAKVNAATGEVTIVGVGTAVITATAAGSDNYDEASASYTLTVSRRASAPSATTPDPEPEPDDGLPFTDVPKSAYYYDAVDWAVGKEITDGVSATQFAPYASCTRAQIVTFLWHAAGSPEPKTVSSFTDVPANAFYADAVNWAVANNVTNGTSATTFSPNADCTRAEIVTFLYRAYQGK